jgi:hypothetical protein
LPSQRVHRKKQLCIYNLYGTMLCNFIEIISHILFASPRNFLNF